ncbi:hypothetical protein KIPB_003570, partial [Kipferlia bialata]|eukprot:g3570.t1
MNVSVVYLDKNRRQFTNLAPAKDKAQQDVVLGGNAEPRVTVREGIVMERAARALRPKRKPRSTGNKIAESHDLPAHRNK